MIRVKIATAAMAMTILTSTIGAISITPPVSEEITVENYIQEESERKGLDHRLVYAVIETESNWQHDLIGDYGESYGIMQIQPQWHQERMTRLGVVDLLDPKQNVTVGIDLLSELIDKYGVERGLTAYNAGNPDAETSYAATVLERIENYK